MQIGALVTPSATGNARRRNASTVLTAVLRCSPAKAFAHAGFAPTLRNVQPAEARACWSLTSWFRHPAAARSRLDSLRLSHLTTRSPGMKVRTVNMEWQPIETAPESQPCLFWLDWADDVIEPNRSPTERLFMGKRRCWTSIYKATHWMPLPPSPTPEDREGASTSTEDA
jgi:hypothetical protein